MPSRREQGQLILSPYQQRLLFNLVQMDTGDRAATAWSWQWNEFKCLQTQGAFCISLCDHRQLEGSNEPQNNTGVMTTLTVTNYTCYYTVCSSPFVINFASIVILLLYLRIHHHCLFKYSKNLHSLRGLNHANSMWRAHRIPRTMKLSLRKCLKSNTDNSISTFCVRSHGWYMKKNAQYYNECRRC
jgi:hypothetical protein